VILCRNLAILLKIDVHRPTIAQKTVQRCQLIKEKPTYLMVEVIIYIFLGVKDDTDGYW